MTERQKYKRQRQKENVSLWCQGSFALLYCFFFSAHESNCVQCRENGSVIKSPSFIILANWGNTCWKHNVEKIRPLLMWEARETLFHQLMQPGGPNVKWAEHQSPILRKLTALPPFLGKYLTTTVIKSLLSYTQPLKTHGENGEKTDHWISNKDQACLCWQVGPFANVLHIFCEPLQMFFSLECSTSKSFGPNLQQGLLLVVRR